MLNIFKKLVNLLFVLVIAILPIFVFVQPAQAVMSWYNSAWLYRKLITATGSTAGAQTNYQIKFNIMHGSGADMIGLNREPVAGNYAMDVGSGATTIVDAALISAVDDFYNGCTFWNATRSLGGTITDYVGTTKTATTTSVAAQANTDVYFIIGRVPTIYLDSKCQTDFDDIRFTKSDGATLLDAWLEASTASSVATVWVELDTIPANPSTTTFYIYYGNSGVASNWNGTNTFITFDDFERGLDGDAVGGSWTVAAGTCTISTDHAYGGTRSVKIRPATSEINIPKIAGSGYAIRERIWKETATIGSRFMIHGNGTNTFYLSANVTEDVQYYNGAWVNAGMTMAPDAWTVFETRDFKFAVPTFDIMYEDIFLADDLAGAVIAVNTNTIGIRSVGEAVGDDFYVDNFIVRKWCSPEPLITSYAVIETAPTPLVIQDVKVFQSYKTTNDWLIVIRYIDIYAPYYDTYDIKQYFVFQLTNGGGTVLAQTAVPMWGNRIGNIYLSPTLAGSLTYGGTYYVKIYGLFTGNPVVSYTLQSTDWQGDDLTRLDSWTISSAAVMSAYYTTAMTTYIAGRGEVLNSTGGSICDTGLNGLSTCRPNIFQTYSTSTVAIPGVFTQTGRAAVGSWQTNIGPDGTVMLTRLGNLIGVPGNLVATFIFVVMMIVLAVIGFAPGATLAANILSIPILFAGVFFGFDLIYILILGVFSSFLLAKKLFMDTGM